jgi:hypothetical protein
MEYLLCCPKSFNKSEVFELNLINGCQMDDEFEFLLVFLVPLTAMEIIRRVGKEG